MENLARRGQVCHLLQVATDEAGEIVVVSAR
jgi:hypothetical protein